MYTIQTAESVEDAENMCYRPTNGGMFEDREAIKALEQGNGGRMECTETRKSYGVSHIKADNDWLRTLLKIK